MSANVKTFMCISDGYWGKGSTLKEAKRNMKGAGWRRSAGRKRKVTIFMLDCDPKDVSCRDMVDLQVLFPKGAVTMKYEEEM